jgi:hypothetical protein
MAILRNVGVNARQPSEADAPPGRSPRPDSRRDGAWKGSEFLVRLPCAEGRA